MSEPRSLAIWTVGESNSTYFTIEGESLIDMMKNEIPINYWRVIHGKNDTTKTDTLGKVIQNDPN